MLKEITENKRFSGFLGVLLLVFSPWSSALDPASIRAGVFELAPMIDLEQRYDTNLYSQPRNETESWVTIISPSIQAATELDKVKLLMGYQNSTGLYEASSADNYSDNKFAGQLVWELNHRNQFDMKAVYIDGHEDRGSGFSQGVNAVLIDEPDTYESVLLDARYTYGSEESAGRLVFNLTNYNLEYTNHRDYTRSRDHDDLTKGITFYWGVGGKTDLLLEGRHTDIEYQYDPDPSLLRGALDSTQTKLQAGLTWEATGKTEGTIKLGRTQKDFDSDRRNDFSGMSWEVEVEWSLKSYSIISLNTSREPRETNGGGSFIDSETIGIDWAHDWNDRFSSKVFYSLRDDTYEDTLQEREDQLETYGLRVDYSMRRWFDVGLSATINDKDSNLVQFPYERSRISLHFSVSL